ncbi:MAG: patatin-like phospholipase family protein, partial [Bacteroidales bacterium]|nr:patatin-like phospholipase family protein [Bacteroidales bacterium]
MKKLVPLLLLLICLMFSALSAQDGNRPKIALVLSGGAALGFAHVGFLKVLEEVGIPIDCVIGNSMGSLVGGLYAVGHSPGDIERLAAEINWAEVFLNEDATRNAALLGNRMPTLRLSFDKSGSGESKGIIPDQNITLLLSRLTYRVSMFKDFAALPIPFRTLAIDIARGTDVPLDNGVLYRAMRSSMSIPAIFAPVPMNGTYFIDAGFLNNNPIDLAREWGADIIIDVDVGSFVNKTPEEINSIGTIIDQTIRLIQNTSYVSNLAVGDDDFRIVMDLSEFLLTDFAKAQKLIMRGEEITRNPENMKMLLELAAKIETTRPLVVRNWQRIGSYMELPEPFFTQVRLVSIGVNGMEESEQTIEERITPHFLELLFADFFGKNADSSKLEAAIEIIRRRGKYASVGYHLEDGEDGGYRLVLTGVKAAERKNDAAFTLSAVLSFGDTYEWGTATWIEFNFNDIFLPNSRLNLNASYAFARMEEPSLSLSYTQTLFPFFSARVSAEGSYLSSSIYALHPVGELSIMSELEGRAQFLFTPGTYLDVYLGYLYKPFRYQNKDYNTATRSSTNTDLLSGDMHFVEMGFHANTIIFDKFLLFSFLQNAEFDVMTEFPFAGSRLPNGPEFPYYERFEIGLRKAWTPRPMRSFMYDLTVGSYRGNLETMWNFYDLSGKAGIPGYGSTDVSGRDKGILGFTYVEEILPLSNILGLRSFFVLTVRGGNVWDKFTSIERLKEFRGGVRTGLQIETPIGM